MGISVLKHYAAVMNNGFALYRSEANDLALRLAQRFTKRSDIAIFDK